MSPSGSTDSATQPAAATDSASRPATGVRSALAAGASSPRGENTCHVGSNSDHVESIRKAEGE